MSDKRRLVRRAAALTVREPVSFFRSAMAVIFRFA